MVMLGGCTFIGPHYKQPVPYTPPKYHSDNNGGKSPAPFSQIVEKPGNPNWWEEFNDPELTSLEVRISTMHLPLLQMAANISASRSQMMLAGAERFPMLGVQGSYRATQPSSEALGQYVDQLGKTTFPAGGSQSIVGPNGKIINVPNTQIAQGYETFGKNARIPLLNMWSYGIDATYEFDFWGRLARQYKAAAAEASAIQWRQRTILIAAQADMAQYYLKLRGDQLALAVLKKNYDTLQMMINLAEDRQKGGLASESEIDELKANAHTVTQHQHDLAMRTNKMQNAIALLLGLPPHALDAELGFHPAIPSLPAEVPVGIPSELCHRRPDIGEAEDMLRASIEETGMAEADFYPKVTIDASFGMSSLSFSKLASWGASTWSIGPSIQIPIFQGGRLYGQLQLKKAQQRAAAINYRSVVMKAWQEVDDALKGYRETQFQTSAALASAEEKGKKRDLAVNAYANGLITYLDALKAQADAENNELQAVNTLDNLAEGISKLFNALGGGWEEILPNKGGKKEMLGAMRVQGASMTVAGMTDNSHHKIRLYKGGKRVPPPWFKPPSPEETDRLERQGSELGTRLGLYPAVPPTGEPPKPNPRQEEISIKKSISESGGDIPDPAKCLDGKCDK
ncbi:outer membrane channel protein [Lasius niger]|uniref:Outer membrane channel protein n=1 Tax=Lasius niger TaxID=67767 RepID=A0A0J7KXN7_LASNI|nr:outer membrane channel protein [Lasius niger]